MSKQIENVKLEIPVGDSGAIPALRGFRKQFLHTFRRVIELDDLRYVPESLEDISVYDKVGNLKELVQVKDHSNPLTISDLRTFFYRSKQIVKEFPAVDIILASYGPIGPELAGFIDIKDEKLQQD